MTINIENEYSEAAGNGGFLSDEQIEKIAEDVVRETLIFESCPYESEVSLLITTDPEIMALNSEFRGIEKSTDVLSFPMIDFESPADFAGLAVIDELFDPDSGELMLGDIVISAEHCIAQAAEYGHSLGREYAFLIAHSMLHLIGYDHEDPADASLMEEKQENILISLGYTR